MLRSSVPTDWWSAMTREWWIGLAVPMLAGRVFSRPGPPPSERDQENLALALRHYPSKLKMAAWLLAQVEPTLRAMAPDQLKAAEAQIGQARTKEDASALYRLRGLYLAKIGQAKEAEENYLRSMEIWPTVNNPVYADYEALMREKPKTRPAL